MKHLGSWILGWKMSRVKKNVIFIVVALIIIVIISYFEIVPYKYYPIIQKASQQYGVPTDKIVAVIRAESNFNPTNKSDKGAVGLMQLLPRTAAYIGEMYNLPYDNLNDPRENIMLGTAYLNYLEKRYPGKNEDLIAYNAGEGRLKSNKWKEYGETNRYIYKVNMFKAVYAIFYFWR